MFENNLYYNQEDRDFHASSAAERDRFDTELAAYNRRDRNSAWLLSDRDCWYPSPFYIGPPCPHPESCESDTEYAAECARLDEAADPGTEPFSQWLRNTIVSTSKSSHKVASSLISNVYR